AALSAISLDAGVRAQGIPGTIFNTLTAPMNILGRAVHGRRLAHRGRHHHRFARHHRSHLARSAAGAAGAGAAGAPEAAGAVTPDQPRPGRRTRPRPRPDGRPRGADRGRGAAAPPPLTAVGFYGPLYWPYAADDLFDYLLRPASSGETFWTRGGHDLTDAMFM